jgi:hypothetical protein
MPGSNLDKAREFFAAATKHRPLIRLTMQQRTRVLRAAAGRGFLAGVITAAVAFHKG